ncbi:MAG TPA: M13 family metallopeptidase [Vitreimonas sp.]|uniref:M13 family metallopeptidase n=1 Tax=Vitreimonas sp. TaxID=3069702 RepID=UPI002D26DD53|nr:M13 family metallopeptidase [Vitreimonas sp.]HYD88915.1 M13 family metallopeptidase [Vitreimonas sp.]
MIALTRRAWGVSSLALLAGCATGTASNTTATARAPAAIGAWGVDLAARDLSVDPGNDFFRYANGTWMANTQIPADRTRWGTFDILRDKSDRDQRVIIEEVALAGGAPGSVQQKIADYYNAYLNQDAIDALRLTTVQAEIDEINAARDHEAAAVIAARPGVAVNFPIATYVSLDQRNPDRYCVGMTHAGIGLPEREYYRRTDGQFPAIREAYQAHIERLLTLAGQTNANRKARDIVAFETRVAERHWPIAERRDRSRTYNLQTRQQIAALAPDFPWDAAFESQGLGQVNEVVVRELSAIGPLANLYTRTPIATIRAYLVYHLVRNNASVLPRDIDNEVFDFYGKTLNGQPQQRERWKRSVDAVNGALGEAVGQIYVQRHFPPEAKAQMTELVENLRRAYGERIDQLSWMSAETKVAAREKLATFRPKIGYPDRWKDYSALEVRAGDAYGNSKRFQLWDWQQDLDRLGRQTDRDEWFMTPQTVNAYYNSVFNEIVFPAAILQPPFFDPNADPAVNYGAIGGVIGHEMGHGFDDQGAKSDARGVLRDWWNAEDVARFTAVTDRLVEQYNGFSPLEGINVNGRLTLGENIGDNGGLQVAYHAYTLSLGGRPAETLDGYTGDQRFFLGWAQAWRGLIRDEALRNQVLTDPHSPAIYRCNGTVRNMDAWYAAFNVTEGDALYLAPADRVTIW